jgi:hypothetical protein
VRAHDDAERGGASSAAIQQAKIEEDNARLALANQRQLGSSTLLELTLARATQVQAASAVASARYTLAFQEALMSYYTGDLDPAGEVLGS